METIFQKRNQVLLILGILVLGLLVVNIMATVDLKAQLGTYRSLEALRMVGRDSVRAGTLFTADGRVVFSSANTTKIDSFTTTALLDTLTMTGAAVGDVLLATPICPLWSATPDTNMHYYAYVLSADTVVVARAKNSPDADAKSAGIYAVAKFEK